MSLLRLLAILIVGTSLLRAQSSITEIDIDRKPNDVISSRDKDGNFFFLFQYNKSYQVVILDSTYKELKRLSIDKSPEDSKKNALIGTIFDERGAVAYLVNNKTMEFYSLRIDRNTGAMSFQTIGQLKDNEYYLKGIEMQGKFYVLAVPKQENTLRLYISDYGNAFTEKTIPIEYSTFYSKLAMKNEDLSQRSSSSVLGIEYVRYDIDNTIRSAHSTKKLYTFNGKITFVFDDPGTTHVIQIDPETSTSRYKKLNFSLDKELNTNPQQGNSFLYQGDLFRVTLSSKQLNLSIVYLDSTMLLRTYNFYPEQSIDIINGVIVQNAMDGQDRTIQKTSTFFNRLLDSELAVTVNNLYDGRYEMQLGGYEEIVTYRNTSSPGLWGMPGLSISLGYGFGFGLPYYYDPFYNPGTNSTTTTTVQLCYFESILRQSDLEHEPGKIPASAQKKIEEYVEKNFKSSTPELFQLIPISRGGILMGVYSKTSGKYRITPFRREAQP